jgi:hypothetical protein
MFLRFYAAHRISTMFITQKKSHSTVGFQLNQLTAHNNQLTALLEPALIVYSEGAVMPTMKVMLVTLT